MDVYCIISTVAAFMAGFMAGLPVIYLILAAKTRPRKRPVTLDSTCTEIK